MFAQKQFHLCEGRHFGHKVTCITSQNDVINLTSCPRTDFDHFPDVKKMVGNFIARIFTGNFRLLNDLAKIFPLVIAQRRLEIPCKPTFNAIDVSCVRLKIFGKGLYEFSVHKVSSNVLFANHDSYPEFPDN